MDAIAQWVEAQQRVIDLVSGLDEARASLTVPACPDWSVHDLLAHMVGLTADVVAGDEPDDHNEDWTQKQVDERTDASVAEIAEEWLALTDPMQKWMRENNTRPLGDVIIHEQDLRGALRVTGAQETEALTHLRNDFASTLGESVHELPTLELRGTRWTWSSRTGTAATTLSAPDFDLARALLSRRSADQLRAWTTAGDIGPYLEKFQALGPLPDADLTETF